MIKNKYKKVLNYNTSIKILKKLALDKDEEIRWGVARHPKTPLNVLKKLSKDKSWGVRFYLLENPNITKEILKILSKDKHNRINITANKMYNL